MNTFKIEFNQNNTSLKVTENNNNVNPIKINDQIEFYFFGYVAKNNKSFLLDHIKKIAFYDYSQIKNINGEFLILVNNKKKKNLKIINDRFASIPLFYYYNKNNFFASNNYFEVLDNLKKKEQIIFDKNIFFEFLYFKRIHGSSNYDKRTIFLNAASVLSIENKKIDTSKYWCQSYSKKKYKNLHEASLELNHVTQNAIKNKINNHSIDNVGLFLSGGGDTRYIASNLEKIYKTNINCFTLGWSEEGEYRITKKICEILNFKNIFLKIDENYYSKHHDQKLYISNGQYNMFQNIFLGHSEKINKISKLLLHGHGFDYMFQGMYLPKKKINLFQKSIPFKIEDNINKLNLVDYYINNISYKTKFNFLNYVLNDQYKNYLFDFIYEKINKLKEDSSKFCNNNNDLWEYFMNHNLSRHYSYTDVLGIGTNGTQRKIANDNNVFDFYLSLPKKMRFNGKIIKHALNILNPKIAQLDSANTGVPFNSSQLGLIIRFIKRKILFKITSKNIYLSKSGKFRTWPDENKEIQENEYLNKNFESFLKSDQIREHLNFLNFSKLEQLWIKQKKNNEINLGQFVMCLLTLKAFIEKVDK